MEVERKRETDGTQENIFPTKDEKHSTGNFLDLKKSNRYAIVTVGCILSFNAGWLNLMALAETQVAASSVTGTISETATLFDDATEYSTVLDRVIVVVAFVVGAFLSGLLLPDEIFNLGRLYFKAFLLEAALIYLAFWFYDKDLIMGALLAGACGVQNAITSRFNGTIMRTTHHTGTLTDIGVVLSQLVQGRTEEAWKLAVLAPLPICFVVGGFASFHGRREWEEYALGVNIIILLVLSAIDIMWLILRRKRENKKKFEAWYDLAPNAAATADGVYKIAGYSNSNISNQNDSKEESAVYAPGTAGSYAATGGSTNGSNGHRQTDREYNRRVELMSEFKEDSMEFGEANRSISIGSKPQTPTSATPSPRTRNFSASAGNSDSGKNLVKGFKIRTSPYTQYQKQQSLRSSLSVKFSPSIAAAVSASATGTPSASAVGAASSPSAASGTGFERSSNVSVDGGVESSLLLASPTIELHDMKVSPSKASSKSFRSPRKPGPPLSLKKSSTPTNR